MYSDLVYVVVQIDAGDRQSAADSGTCEEVSDRERTQGGIEQPEYLQSSEPERKENTTL